MPRVLGLLISLTNQLLGVAVNLGIGVLVLLFRYPTVLTGRRTAAGPPAEGRITKPVDCREVTEPGGAGRSLRPRWMAAFGGGASWKARATDMAA